MTKRMREIVRKMQEGAGLFLVDNESCSGMHLALNYGVGDAAKSEVVRRRTVGMLEAVGMVECVQIEYGIEMAWELTDAGRKMGHGSKRKPD